MTAISWVFLDFRTNQLALQLNEHLELANNVESDLMTTCESRLDSDLKTK